MCLRFFNKATIQLLPSITSVQIARYPCSTFEPHYQISPLSHRINIMGFRKNILFAGAFALCAFAAPVPDCDEAPKAETPGSLTAANLIAISPATASCSGASFPDECADATQAATALNKAFSTYKITSKGEKAAIVAYELFESGDFKYKKNHFPGRPGQGTRSKSNPSHCTILFFSFLVLSNFLETNVFSSFCFSDGYAALRREIRH